MGVFLATSLARTSARGGQPTGTTALATDFRIKDTASPRRNIWTSWPASESTRHAEKGTRPSSGRPSPRHFSSGFSVWLSLLLRRGQRPLQRKAARLPVFLETIDVSYDYGCLV